MDKEYIMKLSSEAMISLNETETQEVLKRLSDFDEAMKELYSVDTSEFLDEEVVNLEFVSLRNNVKGVS